MVSQSTKKAAQLNGTLRLLIRVISAKLLKPILQVDAEWQTLSLARSYNHIATNLAALRLVLIAQLRRCVRNVCVDYITT